MTLTIPDIRNVVSNACAGVASYAAGCGAFFAGYNVTAIAAAAGVATLPAAAPVAGVVAGGAAFLGISVVSCYFLTKAISSGIALCKRNIASHSVSGPMTSVYNSDHS